MAAAGNSATGGGGDVPITANINTWKHGDFDTGAFHFGFKNCTLYGFASCGLLHHVGSSASVKSLVKTIYRHLDGCAQCQSKHSPSRTDIREWIGPALAERPPEGTGPLRLGIIFPEEYLNSWQPLQNLVIQGKFKVVNDNTLKVCRSCFCVRSLGKACCAFAEDSVIQGLIVYQRVGGQGDPFVSAPRDELIAFLESRKAWLARKRDPVVRALHDSASQSLQLTPISSSFIRVETPPPAMHGPPMTSSSSLRPGAFPNTITKIVPVGIWQSKEVANGA